MSKGHFEAKKHASLRQRFWSRIVVRHPKLCWEWTGSKDKFGYGKIGLGGRGDGVGRAHRVSWQIKHGDIPGDLCVLHRCDNPACVNPRHLFLGTRTDNSADKVSKGRSAGPRGEANPRTKLTADKARMIHQRCGSGERMNDVAREFGVSPPAVRDIVRGVTWSYATGTTKQRRAP